MTTSKKLMATIIDAIQDKKGQNIVTIDLTSIEGAIANYFIICQGNSPTQVDAITESVGEKARVELNEKPANVIGQDNSQWVAMDYGDILVHIFLPEVRAYYDLENLWSDAPITEIEDI